MAPTTGVTRKSDREQKEYHRDIESKLNSNDTVFDLLKRDHREIQRLCELILKRNKKPLPEKKISFHELKELVTAHAKAEEAVFYEPLRTACRIKGDDKGLDQVLEGFEEHHVAELLLNEISMIDVSDERFFPKMKFLSETLDHHIQLEESTIFKVAKKDFEKTIPKRMAPQFIREKEYFYKH